MRRRASMRSSGRARPNQIAPRTQAIPPTATVIGAPIRLAKVPPKKAPQGGMTMNIIEYRDLTRPRRWSGTMVWISVFEHAIRNIIEYPQGNRSAADSQNEV